MFVRPKHTSAPLHWTTQDTAVRRMLTSPKVPRQKTCISEVELRPYRQYENFRLVNLSFVKLVKIYLMQNEKTANRSTKKCYSKLQTSFVEMYKTCERTIRRTE